VVVQNSTCLQYSLTGPSVLQKTNPALTSTINLLDTNINKTQPVRHIQLPIDQSLTATIQCTEAAKWFTQVNLNSTNEPNEVYQLIINSDPAQMDMKSSRVQSIENNCDWYLSLFTTPGKEWLDLAELVKEQIATIIFLERRVVLFHGDTYVKQKLSLCGKETERSSKEVSIKTMFVEQSQRHRKLLIEADAGQGKTSLLRHATFLIATAACDQSEKKTIGLYVRADALYSELNKNAGDDRSGITLETVITVFLRQCRSTMAGLCREHLMRFLASVNSIVLLVDSLDELSHNLRSSFLKRIHQIDTQGMVLDDNTRVDQIVIASRPIPEGIAGFDQYTIKPLNASQQNTFVIKHFGAIAESDLSVNAGSWQTLIEQTRSNNLQDKIDNEKLGELVKTCIKALECRNELKTQGNPLLLFLLCLYLEENHDEQGACKEVKLFELYESIIKMTINRSQERLHSDPRFRSLFLPWQAETSLEWLLDLMTVTAFICHWIGSQSEETDDLCTRKERVSSTLSELQKFEDWKLYSNFPGGLAQKELLAGQDLVDVLVSLPGLCQVTREEGNPSVYFVNRTIQEFLTARCCLAMFDGLNFERKSSESWLLLCGTQIPGADSIPKYDFWKKERIVCNKWWGRVIKFAASYDHGNETGLGWLWRSIDGPNEPGIDKTDLGMVRLWHLLQAFPSVSTNEQEMAKLDQIYLWVLERSAIGAYRLVEENTNVGALFGKGGLEISKKRWEKLINSKGDNIEKQLAVDLIQRCASKTHQDENKESSDLNETEYNPDSSDPVNQDPESFE